MTEVSRCLDSENGWQLVKDKKTGEEWWQLLDKNTPRVPGAIVTGDNSWHRDYGKRTEAELRQLNSVAEESEESSDEEDDEALLAKFDGSKADNVAPAVTPGDDGQQQQAKARAAAAAEAEAEAKAKEEAAEAQRLAAKQKAEAEKAAQGERIAAIAAKLQAEQEQEAKAAAEAAAQAEAAEAAAAEAEAAKVAAEEDEAGELLVRSPESDSAKAAARAKLATVTPGVAHMFKSKSEQPEDEEAEEEQQEEEEQEQEEEQKRQREQVKRAAAEKAAAATKQAEKDAEEAARRAAEAKAAAAAEAQKARAQARIQSRKKGKGKAGKASKPAARTAGGSSARVGGWRCPYLRFSLATSLVLLLTVLAMMAGAVWLNTSTPAVPAQEVPEPETAKVTEPEVLPEAVAPAPEPAKSSKRGRLKKPRIRSTSQFQRERRTAAAALAASFSITEPTECVFTSTGGLRMAPADGSDSELLVDLTAAPPALEQDECTEGWAGADCQDCAPGFHGDFCDQRIAVQPVPGAPAPDSQLPAPVAAPVLPPRRGAIDLRDYVLPPADENETATPGVGMPVFSRGISVVAAHEMLSMAGHAPLVSI